MQSGGRVKNKIPCFQHILLNTFRQIGLKYDNYSLRRILFQTSKQHSHCKSLIAKVFDGTTTSPIYVQVLFMWQRTKMNVPRCFSIKPKILHWHQTWTLTLILRACFFASPIGRATLLAHPIGQAKKKTGRVEVNLSSPAVNLWRGVVKVNLQ